MLLASGGYLLFHHHAFNNSNPTSPATAAGANSTPCDCTTNPPPTCECNNTTMTEAEEEEMANISSNNRRPSINLQIICPTPPPLVDRQVMPSHRPHICHRYHRLYLWRKISHVEKFQISVKNLNNLWSFIEIYAVFVQICVEKNLCGENHCGEKMTNMRSGRSRSFAFRAWAMFCTKQV